MRQEHYDQQYTLIWNSQDGLLIIARIGYERILGECIAPLVIGSFKYTSPFLIFMLKPQSGLVHTQAL